MEDRHARRKRWLPALRGIGPRSTPTVDGGVVYTQGAGGRLLALDGASGEVLWQKDLLAELGMTAEPESTSCRWRADLVG